MHRITFAGNTDSEHQAMLVGWLDKQDITWTERLSDGSWTIITALSIKQEQDLIQWISILVPGAVLAEYTPAPVNPAPVGPATLPAGVPLPATWYQYIARVRNVARHRITTDRLDSVMWFKESDEGFMFAIKRVTYRETVRRDVVTGTKIEVAMLFKQPCGKYDYSTFSSSTEKAPDSLNFGDVADPQTYWSKLQADLPWKSGADTVVQNQHSYANLAYVLSLGNLITE